MSAYLCTPKHIGALAAWAVSNDHLAHTMERLARDAGVYGYDLADLPGAVAGILASENIASVAYRYPHDREGNRPGPLAIKTDAQFVEDSQQVADELVHTLRIKDTPAVWVLKAVDCLEYQSCERPEFEHSAAFKILNAIRRSAITKLPGYSDAAWGWSQEAPRTPENLARAARGERPKPVAV